MHQHRTTVLCHRKSLSYAQRYNIRYNNIAFNKYKSTYCCTTNCTITVVIIFFCRELFILRRNHCSLVEQTHKKHKNTLIDGGKQNRRQRTPKTRKTDTELLPFEENCIILRKSYFLLILLLMLLYLLNPAGH